jgi:hypothetical protein
MPVVSVTRLRLRAWRYFPSFLFRTWTSVRQARRSRGFHEGTLAGDAEGGKWTLTVWADAEDLRAFRNSGAHLAAMPRLLRWCDEASFVQWDVVDPRLPTPQEAHERLAHEGRLSKLRHPSAAHQQGTSAPASAPRYDLRLTARAR